MLCRWLCLARAAIVFPLGMAAAATPRLAVKGNRHIQRKRQVSGGIKLLKTHIQRIALRASRLLIQPHTLHVKAFKNRLIEQIPRCLRIFRPNAQLYASHKVRDEPIEPHQIVVAQEALDPSRFEAALGQQRFGQIAKLPDGYERTEIECVHRLGIFRKLKMTAVEFIFQRIPGHVGERLGIARQPQKFAVRHSGISTRQADTLPGIVEIGHWARIPGGDRSLPTKSYSAESDSSGVAAASAAASSAPGLAAS